MNVIRLWTDRVQIFLNSHICKATSTCKTKCSQMMKKMANASYQPTTKAERSGAFVSQLDVIVIPVLCATLINNVTAKINRNTLRTLL